MSEQFQVKFGESVHCVELNTGEEYSGNFLFSGDGIVTTLYSYEGPFLVEHEGPIFLDTEKLEVVSLYHNFGTSPGTASFYGEPEKHVHTQRIFSNCAVVGHDEWRIDDKVKRVSFQVDGTFELLKNYAQIERLSLRHSSKDDVEDRNAWLLVHLRARGFVLRIFYTATYQSWGREPIEIVPRFEIEFDEAVQLGEQSNLMYQVVSFCSMVMGVPLVPSEVRLSRQSLDEFMADVQSGRMPSEHRYFFRSRTSDVKSEEFFRQGFPVMALEAEHVGNFADCLQAWLERGDQWRSSYELMMGALWRRYEFGAEKLLNACRWLEEIPIAGPAQKIDDADLSEIATAAIECAIKRGFPDLRDRIMSSISRIGVESRAELFERLLRTAWAGFPVDERSIQQMVSDLKRSQTLRGKAAHGHLNLGEAKLADDCINSTDALEALCLLLTVRDLPLTSEGRGRLMHHCLIDGYRANRGIL